MTVHVWSDGVEWVVAEDHRDALCVWAGALWEEAAAYPDLDNWELCPDEELLKIWCDRAGVPAEPHAEGNAIVERTCAEWARLRGRSYLCTTEG